MASNTKVILNPYANRWKASQQEAAICAALDMAGVDFDLEISSGPGHCEQIAAEATDAGYSGIAAAGGDGTLGEVVNGILRHAAPDTTLPTLAVIPIGTANDFAANLGLRPSLEAAVNRIRYGKTCSVDICSLNGRYFINNAGLGLEPEITAIQQRMKGVSGIVRYLLATFMGIAANPQWKMSLEWDTGAYDGPATLISIGNGARTGGLFYTVPAAQPADGLLTFICGNIPTRSKILRAFPMILRAGKGNISEHPAVLQHHCTWLKISTTPATYAHADGELFSEKLSAIELTILPNRLKVFSD